MWNGQQWEATGDGYASKADPTLSPTPHFIPLPTTGSSDRPSKFDGRTVGGSEAELLPSKQVPHFLLLLTHPKV